MNNKILIGSIVILITFILISLHPVIALSFQNQPDFQESIYSSKGNNIVNNNYGIIWVHFCFIKGFVKNAYFQFWDYDPEFVFTPVDVTAKGRFRGMGHDEYYFYTYEFDENQNWEYEGLYVGVNMIRFFLGNFFPINCFLRGMLFGGYFYRV